jgi:hypothetical protein
VEYVLGAIPDHWRVSDPKKRMMDDLERNVLWLGIEDYTGLWEAALEAGPDTEPSSFGAVQARARLVIESLLGGGFIELFVFQGLVVSERAELVPPERHASVLGDDDFWKVPEGEGELAGFAATEQGFAAYKKAVGWTNDRRM